MRHQITKYQWLQRALEEHRSKHSHLPSKEQPCLLWPWATSAGRYGVVVIGETHLFAHRVAFEIVHGTIPNGLSACHTCDVGLCFNPAHIFLGTQADNMKDCAQKKRSTFLVHPELQPRGNRHGSKTHPESRPVGSNHPIAKLNEAQVEMILQRLSEGQLQSTIARDFSVCQMTISNINTKKIWRHVSRLHP